MSNFPLLKPEAMSKNKSKDVLIISSSSAHNYQDNETINGATRSYVTYLQIFSHLRDYHVDHNGVVTKSHALKHSNIHLEKYYYGSSRQHFKHYLVFDGLRVILLGR
jgi:hypothetical protein